MYFGHSNPKHRYYLNDSLICECNEEKDLGITFNPSLKIKVHINNIVSKGNQVLALIKCNVEYLDNETLRIWTKHVVALSKI